MFDKKNTRQIPDAGDPPAGFALHEPMVCVPGKERDATRVQLLVPIHRILELEEVQEEKDRLRESIIEVRNRTAMVAAEQQRKETRRELERKAEQEAQEEAQEEARREAQKKIDLELVETARIGTNGAKVLPPPPKGIFPPNPNKKFDTTKPPARLKGVVESLDYSPATEHPVFSPDAPLAMYTRAQVAAGERDAKKRDLELSHRLADMGLLRSVAAPKGIEQLNALYDSHPNFSEVIDLVKNQILLAERSGKAPRIPPILLDGEPGLGKTHFASALAEVLRSPIQRIAFDASTTAAKMIGTDRHWANTTVGGLFELVCLGTHANPVFVLDEVDKAVGIGRSYQDPLAALHSLLEPSTACRVKDQSADMEFDASLVTWIATANRAHLLPDSLRSRFREFRIKRLTAEQSIRATKSMVEITVDGLELDGFELPGRAFCVSLAHLVPREIQQAVQQAVAAAVANGRTHVRVEDIPAQFRDDESKPAGGNSWLH